MRTYCLSNLHSNHSLETFLLFKTRKNWKNAHRLLFSVACADLILGIYLVIHFVLEQSEVIQRNFSVEYSVTNGIIFLNLHGSSFNILLLTTDRVVAVVKPFEYRFLMTKIKIYLGIGISWLLAFVVVVTFTVPQALCQKPGEWHYVLSAVALFDVAFMITSYVIRWYYSRRSTREVKGYEGTEASWKRPSENRSKQVTEKSEHNKDEDLPTNTACKVIVTNKIEIAAQVDIATLNTKRSIRTQFISFKTKAMPVKEKRLLKMSILIVVLFSLSFLPGGIGTFIMEGKETSSSPISRLFIYLSGIAGSLYNPVVYFL